MKDVDPNWLLGSLYPDFIVGAGRPKTCSPKSGRRREKYRRLISRR
jgi:hypothetical protein